MTPNCLSPRSGPRVPHRIQGSGHRTEGQLPSPGDSSVRGERAALGQRVERGGDGDIKPGQAASATCLCCVHSLPIGWHLSGTPPRVQDPGLVARLPAGLQGGWCPVNFPTDAFTHRLPGDTAIMTGLSGVPGWQQEPQGPAKNWISTSTLGYRPN